MAEDTPDFPRVVNEEADSVERFVYFLEREKVLLTEGRTDALALVVDEKERLAPRLNELTQRRDRYLAEHGLASGDQGMEAWATGHPEREEVLAIWRRTLSLVERAKELNRLNEILIQMNMQYVNQALEILSRKESPLALYGSDGRSAASEGQQINDAV
jgi:flagellar biosynthesis/type III secretory pathway chaperone